MSNSNTPLPGINDLLTQPNLTLPIDNLIYYESLVKPNNNNTFNALYNTNNNNNSNINNNINNNTYNTIDNIIMSTNNSNNNDNTYNTIDNIIMSTNNSNNNDNSYNTFDNIIMSTNNNTHDNINNDDNNINNANKDINSIINNISNNNNDNIYNNKNDNSINNANKDINSIINNISNNNNDNINNNKNDNSINNTNKDINSIIDNTINNTEDNTYNANNDINNNANNDINNNANNDEEEEAINYKSKDNDDTEKLNMEINLDVNPVTKEQRKSTENEPLNFHESTQVIQIPSTETKDEDKFNMPSNTLDEAIITTILRDLTLIYTKLKFVVIPYGSKDKKNFHIKQWDLWGPLILDLVLACTLALNSKEKSQMIILVFSIFWLGGVILYLNANFLGVKASIFQIFCLLGYCLFPLDVSAILVTLFNANVVIRFILVGIMCGWSIYSSSDYLKNLTKPEQRYLVLYPCILFYLYISWFIISARKN